MSSNYPTEVYTDSDWKSPFAQEIYAKCREIAGIGSDPRNLFLFSPGPDSKPYITYLHLLDVPTTEIVWQTEDKREGTRAWDFASFWLCKKQAAMLSEGQTQEEAEIVT